jgi:hypothetical protein
LCDDGDACNGIETCDSSDGCISGSTLHCDDGKSCTVDYCDHSDGCQYDPIDCDDHVACTIDTCDGVDSITGNGNGNDNGNDCQHTPDDTLCDDGLYCNGEEFCTGNGCLDGEPPCQPSEHCDEERDVCVSNECYEFTVTFETEDDLLTALLDGQDVSTPPEFGRLLNITSDAGDHEGAAIFNSEKGGSNDGGPDPDLLVDCGNILILQNSDDAAQSVAGIFDIPNDSPNGGVIRFDFLTPGGVEARSIDVIDVDLGNSMTMTLTDINGSECVLAVDPGFTGDGGKATFSFDDCAPDRAANVALFFELDHVVSLDVTLTGSGALDNLVFCSTDTCEVDNDCQDDDGCTNEACAAQFPLCIYPQTGDDCCTSDADCEEGQSCDPDDGICKECLSDDECDDDDACTVGDTCEDGTCLYAIIDCSEGKVCDPSTGECIEPCEVDNDCDDGNDCTTDACIDDRCIHTLVNQTGSLAGVWEFQFAMWVVSDCDQEEFLCNTGPTTELGDNEPCAIETRFLTFDDSNTLVHNRLIRGDEVCGSPSGSDPVTELNYDYPSTGGPNYLGLCSSGEVTNDTDRSVIMKTFNAATGEMGFDETITLPDGPETQFGEQGSLSANGVMDPTGQAIEGTWNFAFEEIFNDLTRGKGGEIINSFCGSGAFLATRVDGCDGCTSDDQCNDGDPCTTDTCNDGACEYDTIEGCMTCSGVEDCPEVDLVFAIDTSGSMDEDAAAVCASIDGIVSDLANSGVTVNHTILGIEETADEADDPGFSCLENSVLNLLGIDVPGTDDELDDTEDWGPATAMLADGFDWTSGALRIIVPISDTDPQNGGGCNGDDDASIANAIAMANANDVIVSPIFVLPHEGCDAPDDPNSVDCECSIPLANQLAEQTGGTYFASTDPSGMAAIITNLVTSACESAECDDDDPCTADSCDDDDGICVHSDISNCCESDEDCSGEMSCDLQSMRCVCTADAQCGDGNDCTTDSCDSGRCSNTTIPGCGGGTNPPVGGGDNDDDDDGILNGDDNCRSVPNGPNQANEAGVGNQTDTDGDDLGDACDDCPDDPDNDADGDGACAGDDACPADGDKSATGECGCGVPDTDSNDNGTADCNEPCPDDPDKDTAGACGCGEPETDTDEDGAPDCVDDCPNDQNKMAPGLCGCGNAEVDSDGDGVCDEPVAQPTPQEQPPTPQEEATQEGPDECGCGSMSAGMALTMWLTLGLIKLTFRRRRR